MSAAPMTEDLPVQLKELANRLAIPGLAVALVAGDREAVHYFGEDSPGSARAVGPDTWFQAASTGKHVTACVVLDLAAQGAFRLGDAIGDYLSDLPDTWRDRSIASLLRHSSGLPEYLTYQESERPPVTRGEFMTLLRSLEPIADEGRTWSYSNTNYILAGLLAAIVSGRSCGRLIEDLFRRMGVERARAASPDWVRRANASRLDKSARDSASLDREVIGDGDVAFAGAGALDWLRVLLNAPAISATVDNELFAPARLASGKVPYACGWFLEETNGAAIAHHAGHYDGWTAMALLNRSRRCGVIALCNLAPGSTRAVRAIAVHALEAFAPGTTPLALDPIEDDRPDLTAEAQRQLMRRGKPVDRDAFATDLQLAIDRAGPVRGIVDLWSGEAPAAFRLVEDIQTKKVRTRRYRLTYGARVEHVRVDTDVDDRIAWAWPL